MTYLQIIGFVAAGVFVLILALIVLSKIVLRMLQAPLEGRVAAHYGPDDILMSDLKANCFGVESAGVWRLRGNGALVLTATHLHFFMFWPSRELLVPLDGITELMLTKSHLGKATIYDLLKVRFCVDGKSDSIAWYLTDPHSWKQRIEELKSTGLKHQQIDDASPARR